MRRSLLPARVFSLVDRGLAPPDTKIFAQGELTHPEALASMGEMRFRMFEPAAQNLSTGAQDAQVMVRHPNYSGLQMDQVTRHYIPAHFIQSLVVKQGDAPILAVEGGISLSEDPNVRFTYRSNGEDITVEATDTEGKVFRSSWPQEMRRAS